MTISDTEIWLPNISFPICTSFKPAILEGQLCFKIQVNSSSGMGDRNELALLLDYQDELSIQPPTQQEKKQSHNENGALLDFNADVHGFNTEAAKVHIDTLSSFAGFGGGVYKMTSVKRMTVSEDFLQMPLKDRNCEVQKYENCRTKKLVEGCSCVPWEMSMPAYQVMSKYMFQI